MKVQVFAALKDHFDQEFELDTPVNNTEDLTKVLTAMRPSIANLLSSCRFAVNDTFIDQDFKLQYHDNVAIIPPSSGG